jgi:hypothetical protein
MSFLGSSKGIRAQARQQIANGPIPLYFLDERTNDSRAGEAE